MDKIVPLFRALFPFLFMTLAAFGIELSPEMREMVEENLMAILIAAGALGTAFPSIRAALKFKGDAK